MPRTVVYDNPAEQRHFSALVASEGTPILPKQRHAMRAVAFELATANTPVPEGAVPASDLPNKDDYLNKLAKYVPAEAITVTTLGFAAFNPTGNTVWVAVLLGALANLLYLYSTALQASKQTAGPRWYFYLLSVIAFALWSVAVIDQVQGKAGITGDRADAQQTFILAAAAFVIPAIDSIATYFYDATHDT